MASYENRSGRVRAVVRHNGRKHTKTFNTKSEAVLWASSIEVDVIYSKQKKADNKATGRHVPASLRPILERYLDEVTPTKRSAENEAIMLRGLLKCQGIFDTPIIFCSGLFETFFI